MNVEIGSCSKQYKRCHILAAKMICELHHAHTDKYPRDGKVREKRLLPLMKLKLTNNQ